MYWNWRPLEYALSNIQFSLKSTSEWVFIRETPIQTVLIVEFFF